MAWNDNLTHGTPAHGIASSTHTRIRVLAGPGTGKSFAMKRRIARILEVDGVDPSKILAVTFTRIAAEDLHRELISLGVSGADRLNGKTLHSLAMAILRQAHVFSVLDRHPRPLNKFEMEPLLSDLGHHGYKKDRKKLIRAYGAAWARLQTEEPGFTRTQAEQAFIDDLVRWLRFHEAMLIDELIPHLYQYLKSNPSAPERSEYEHLLVDEYQDLNRAEQEVLHFLGENGSICVIGDDDQSIYSFKHAHPDGIREWVNIHSADDHAIDECRRCPTTVVRMANSLISKNSSRVIGRRMSEYSGNGPGAVAVRQYETADKEAEAIANKIENLTQGGISPNEIIVLTQRETFAKPIFDLLKRKNIPVKSYFAESALDTIESQERFAILKLLLNENDRVALRWLLGCDVSKWRTDSYLRLMHYINANGGSPWSTLCALSDGSISIPKTGALVLRFKKIKSEIDALSAISDVDQLIQVWLPDEEKTAMLAEVVKESREEISDIQSLRDVLYEKITQPEAPIEVSDVRIMSLHKSKGLSAPFVFIAGCVEGLLPSSPGVSMTALEKAAKLEEDRRLFYVGITRVKAKLPDRIGYLAITYPQKMSTAEAYANQITPARTVGRVAFLQASRFIGEMMPHVPVSESDTPL